MTPEESLTTRKSLTELITIWVCVCAFSLFSAPQFVVSSWAQLAQESAPVQEDSEDCKEEREVLSLARHRVKNRRHTFICRLQKLNKRPPQVSSFVRDYQAIIGHQFANGLCAPLLV